MLVITVELWPRGDAALRRTLGVATLANEGRCWGQPERCWYSGEVQADLLGGGEETRKVAAAALERTANPWRLILRFLGEAFGAEA